MLGSLEHTGCMYLYIEANGTVGLRKLLRLSTESAMEERDRRHSAEAHRVGRRVSSRRTFDSVTRRTDPKPFIP